MSARNPIPQVRTLLDCFNAIENSQKIQIDVLLENIEWAKKENTIAVLETGSGKTLIAVLLIRHVLDRELEDRAKGMPHRTTFFIV